MKKILLLLSLTATSYLGYSQNFVNGSPGFTGAPELVDNAGNPTVNPNQLNVGQPIKLRIGFQNSSFAYRIPNNTTQVQLDLGNRMRVNTNAYNIATAPHANYFDWTIQNNGGNQIIVGTQRAGAGADIPPGQVLVFEFEVRPTAPIGSSSIVGNILLPNTNPVDKTTDPNDNDNATNAAYAVTTALPVKFVNVEAQRVNCNVDVTWNVAEQINVRSYEVEVSKNGASFGKTIEIAAINASSHSYKATFALTDDIKANVLYVRIKQVDFDGKTSYSEVRTVKGTCDDAGRWVVYAYPNPVTTSGHITIKAKEGVFKGKYKMELIDNNGKLYQQQDVLLDNAASVDFKFKTTLSPGNYNIRISNMDGSQVSTVQFVKLGVL